MLPAKVPVGPGFEYDYYSKPYANEILCKTALKSKLPVRLHRNRGCFEFRITLHEGQSLEDAYQDWMLKDIEEYKKELENSDYF